LSNQRILAVLELRSNTMRMGVHRDTLAGSLVQADKVLMLKPGDLNWNLDRVTGALKGRGQAYATVEEIIVTLAKETQPDDHVLIMSNGGFDNIQARCSSVCSPGLRSRPDFYAYISILRRNEMRRLMGGCVAMLMLFRSWPG
jgi:UDP-N-acetylmuramate: L-alanyl-gamma-D-glutamyl-meso-diaminopimelate ligase